MAVVAGSTGSRVKISGASTDSLALGGRIPRRIGIAASGISFGGDENSLPSNNSLPQGVYLTGKQNKQRLRRTLKTKKTSRKRQKWVSSGADAKLQEQFPEERLSLLSDTDFVYANKSREEHSSDTSERNSDFYPTSLARHTDFQDICPFVFRFPTNLGQILCLRSFLKYLLVNVAKRHFEHVDPTQNTPPPDPTDANSTDAFTHQYSDAHESLLLKFLVQQVRAFSRVISRIRKLAKRSRLKLKTAAKGLFPRTSRQSHRSCHPPVGVFNTRALSSKSSSSSSSNASSRSSIPIFYVPPSPLQMGEFGSREPGDLVSVPLTDSTLQEVYDSWASGQNPVYQRIRSVEDKNNDPTEFGHLQVSPTKGDADDFCPLYTSDTNSVGRQNPITNRISVFVDDEDSPEIDGFAAMDFAAARSAPARLEGEWGVQDTKAPVAADSAFSFSEVQPTEHAPPEVAEANVASADTIVAYLDFAQASNGVPSSDNTAIDDAKTETLKEGEIRKVSAGDIKSHVVPSPDLDAHTSQALEYCSLDPAPPCEATKFAPIQFPSLEFVAPLLSIFEPISCNEFLEYPKISSTLDSIVEEDDEELGEPHVVTGLAASHLPESDEEFYQLPDSPSESGSAGRNRKVLHTIEEVEEVSPRAPELPKSPEKESEALHLLSSTQVIPHPYMDDSFVQEMSSVSAETPGAVSPSSSADAPKIIYHTYNPCTRTRKAWYEYDSDSENDSIYQDFFASHGKKCPCNPSHRTKRHSQVPKKDNRKQPVKVTKTSPVEIPTTNSAESSDLSLEKSSEVQGPGGWTKVSLGELFASVTPSPPSLPDSSSPTKDNCGSCMENRLVDMTPVSPPKTAEDAIPTDILGGTVPEISKISGIEMTASSLKEETFVATCGDTVKDTAEDTADDTLEEVSEDRSLGVKSWTKARWDRSVIPFREIIPEEVLMKASNTDHPLNEDSTSPREPNPNPVASDEIEDLAEKCRHALFRNSSLWMKTELLLIQLEEDHPATSEVMPKTIRFDDEQEDSSSDFKSNSSFDGSHEIDTIKSSETVKSILARGSPAKLKEFSDFAGEWSKLSEDSSDRISGADSTAKVRDITDRYRHVFVHLINNVVLPCDAKVRNLVGDILSIRRKECELISLGAGAGNEISIINENLRSESKTGESYWTDRLQKCDSSLGEMETKLSKNKENLESLENGFASEISAISELISNVRSIRNDVLERYYRFCQNNDPQAGFGLQDVHQYTCVNDYERKTMWYHDSKIERFGDLLVDNIGALRTSNASVGVMVTSIHECLAKVKHTIQARYSISGDLVGPHSEGTSNDDDGSDDDSVSTKQGGSPGKKFKRRRKRNKPKKNKRPKHRR